MTATFTASTWEWDDQTTKGKRVLGWAIGQPGPAAVLRGYTPGSGSVGQVEPAGLKALVADGRVAP